MSHMEHPTRPASDGIASVIDTERHRQDMSLRNLAVAAHIPLTTLHRRMARGGSFLLPELDAIADVLGIPTSTLVARAEET